MRIKIIYFTILCTGIFAFVSCSNSYQALGSSDDGTIKVDNSVLTLGDYLRRVPQLHVSGTGSNLDVQIRENSSQVGSASPLYVIDGQKMGREYDRVARTIDPNDIKSVKALTHTSETAIYGFDGASGVILITTKDE